MTPAQKFHFYFPAWNACVKANGWHMRGGMVQFDGGRLTEEGVKMVTFARQRALMAKRPMSIDDFRHGAHWLALGRDKSSEHLTNAEVDRVVALFRLLANPDDLGARMKWDAYTRGEDPGAVQRVDWFIRQAAPAAYTAKVSLDMCGTRDWESLPIAKKNVLARALKQRNASFRKPVQRRDAEPQRHAELGHRPNATAVASALCAESNDNPDWSVE